MSDTATTTTEPAEVSTSGDTRTSTASSSVTGGNQFTFTITGPDGQPYQLGPNVSDDELLPKQAEKFVNDPTAIATLLADNYRLRQARRELRAELDQVKSSLPGDDKAVLSKKAAESLDAYAKLGGLDDLKAMVEKFPGLQEENRKLHRLSLVERASRNEDGSMRYKPHVLLDILGSTDIEGVDGEDGWQLRVAVPKEGTDEPELLPISEWLEAHRKDYLPAVMTGGAQQAPTVVGGSRPGQNDTGKQDWRSTASTDEVRQRLLELGLDANF